MSPHERPHCYIQDFMHDVFTDVNVNIERCCVIGQYKLRGR